MTETLVSAWQAARLALTAAGIEEPTFDARLLLEAGASIRRHDILTDPRRILTDDQVARVTDLVGRRVRREPISQILGEKGFRTIVLKVTRDVLTPRPETEVLVHAALEAMPQDTPLRVLDFGVGSGAILCALLTERPGATGLGIDTSEAALLVAQSNIEALGLTERANVRRGDWGEGVDGVFDVIVANPPYIPTNEIAALQPEVALYEPHLALDGGADGLDAYRTLAPQIARLLKPGGLAAFEIGAGQDEGVRDILSAAGLTPGHLYRDLSGIPRVWTAAQSGGLFTST
ncbi:MAG: peptide chain release factor N(5)-glutamine methyltransferase [Caulobacterales bacterium]